MVRLDAVIVMFPGGPWQRTWLTVGKEERVGVPGCEGLQGRRWHFQAGQRHLDDVGEAARLFFVDGALGAVVVAVHAPAQCLAAGGREGESKGRCVGREGESKGRCGGREGGERERPGGGVCWFVLACVRVCVCVGDGWVVEREAQREACVCACVCVRGEVRDEVVNTQKFVAGQ